MVRTTLWWLLLTAGLYSHAQPVIPGAAVREGDTIQELPVFSREEAWNYIHESARVDWLWRNRDDSIRADLNRLLDHTLEPYDSIAARLENNDLSAIPVRLVTHLRRDSTGIRWLNDSTFITDTMGWNMSLLVKQPAPAAVSRQVDSIEAPSGQVQSDQVQRDQVQSAQELAVRPVVPGPVIDTAALESLGIDMFGYRQGLIDPSPVQLSARQSVHVTADSSFLVVTDTLVRWVADPSSPFRYLHGEHQLDSLEGAIRTLLTSNDQRDSTRIVFSDLFGKETPMWLSRGNDQATRFWAKNYRNDSITLWLSNPAPLHISLMLEDEVRVDRMSKAELPLLPRNPKDPDRQLADMVVLESNPIFWSYDLTSSFTLNQTYLANWTKGGESSLSTMLDITAGAIYNNKEANTEWINSMRMNIGTLLTPDKGLRKNNDLVELNSKFNRNASGKFGFSATFYMKSQLAKGYNYPNDSVVVSRFLNPASMTVGIGAEYKPFKNTSINVAPLSYRNTFVLDTARIDQTKHGIAADRRAKQELGTQVVVYNKFTGIEDLTVTNRLRLFSNYLDKPQNIDVDWEMMLDRKINWFFTIRLNLHLIYDDNVRFTVLDAEDQPVLEPDGREKKVAKAQFKEFMGLSLVFQF